MTKIKSPKGNKSLLLTLLIVCLYFFRIHAQQPSKTEVITVTDKEVKTGASRMEAYLSGIKGKRIALVANHSSLIGGTHLVDTLLSGGVKISRVFAPEHGFRGEADAGEHVASGKDSRTGIPLVSLYGTQKKPKPEHLSDVDLVIFDIQDVGVRFYTYISTMTYVMEACADAGIPFMVLDRPNPNGHYIDGPLLDTAFRSFLGLHPVPLVHGMTVGEYATMINTEGWLKSKNKCKLEVIPCTGWKHRYYYQVQVPPSPNLTSMNAIYLYPSLGLFEGTMVSIGRGTDKPFEKIGFPGFAEGNYSFTPKSGKGSKHPLYEGKTCSGFDLKGFGESYIRDSKEIYLFWLINMFKATKDKNGFFTKTFDQHIGTDQLRKDIIAGKTEKQIRDSWKQGLTNYSKIRKKYLLYEE
jgi:uncharacterized protein YbbC (DUF1343 family)